MKRFIPLSLLVASAAFASSVFDVWTDKDAEAYTYLDSNWLGGTLELSAVSADEADQLQVRVKMTGAGSIPQGSSVYFVAKATELQSLPFDAPLSRTNAKWQKFPGPARGQLSVDSADRQFMAGTVDGYAFEALATKSAE